MVAVWLVLAAAVAAHPGHEAPDGGAAPGKERLAAPTAAGTAAVAGKPSRTAVLVGSVTVFVLAVFVGFEIINKVPPTLHTPLMSGSNAISGITVVGAILASGSGRWDAAAVLGCVAAALANINVVGGFVVTHRMLRMFKKR
jgi:NAD(P) transhydrogenase subunit alpha